MDSSVYIDLMQDRVFLALAGLLVAFALDAISGFLLRHHADPRPVFERFIDFVTTPVIRRMNRAGRADTTLLLRGVVVLAFTCAVVFVGVAFGYQQAVNIGQGGVFLTMLVAFSTATVSWFAPLRALVRALADKKAALPYMVLARASYSNLITLDDSGMMRVLATAALRSCLLRLVAPVIVFVLLGWQGLAVYWPVITLALSAGQDGTNRNFALIANGLATVLLVVPALVLFPVLLIALFFSGGASFFRSIPALFKITQWPPLLQGGAPIMLVAYAMKLTLGGPRQDRTGAPVAASWVGPAKGTAKLEPRDIGRILYLQAVTLLIFTSTLYFLSVLF